MWCIQKLNIFNSQKYNLHLIHLYFHITPFSCMMESKLKHYPFLKSFAKIMCKPSYITPWVILEQEEPEWWLHEVVRQLRQVLFRRLAGSLQHRKAPGSPDSLIPKLFDNGLTNVRKRATFLRKVQTSVYTHIQIHTIA